MARMLDDSFRDPIEVEARSLSRLTQAYQTLQAVPVWGFDPDALGTLHGLVLLVRLDADPNGHCSTLLSTEIL